METVSQEINTELFLTATEAARKLGVTYQTLANWRAARERIRFYRVGDGTKPRIYYDPADVEKYINRRIIRHAVPVAVR